MYCFESSFLIDLNLANLSKISLCKKGKRYQKDIQDSKDLEMQTTLRPKTKEQISLQNTTKTHKE